MQTALILMAVQGLIGAFDNIWHHELTQKLSSKPDARGEFMLHTVREFLYAVIFLGIAWFEWNGAWAIVLLLMMAVEVVVTLWDFVIEDQTRKLPGLERIVHTVLAINFGAILAFFLPVALQWRLAETGFAAVDYGVLSWIMSAYGVGVLLWAFYDLRVVVRLSVPEWKTPAHPARAQAGAADCSGYRRHRFYRQGGRAGVDRAGRQTNCPRPQYLQGRLSLWAAC